MASMFDPPEVLSQILTNITSNAHPLKPQLPSLFDYFVKTYSDDLIHPAAIQKWTENYNTVQMTRMNNESSSNEEFYSIPASFVNQVAVEVFESLSDSDHLEIQQANERAYHDAMNKYKDQMKKMYRGEGTGHGEYESLEMVACVLEPIMAALEALTDLHMVGWAGGSASSGIGIIKISGQCDGPTEPPMKFPRSQTESIRHAAQQWMAQVGGQVIERWLGTCPQTSTGQGITGNVAKRRFLGEDIRLVKKTKTADATAAPRHSAETSSLALQSMPELNRCSFSTVSQAPSSQGQMIESQNSVTRRALLPPVFAFPTPTGTPLRSVLAPQRLNERQSFSTYMRHRSGSLPPIRTLNQDEGSTTYRSQVTPSASEGLQLLIQKREQKKNDPRVAADKEYRKSFSPLIATIPDSAKNLLYGLKTVIEVDLGSAFRDIVTLLIEIETLYGFRSPRRGLPTRLRPCEVSNWISAGRGRSGGKVTVVDIEQFSKAWWKWWTDMQPNWRELDAHGKPKQMIPTRAEEDWTCLHKPGPNGLISVIAGLYGWGAAVKKQTVLLGEKEVDWLCAVEDCRWVMARLFNHLQKKKEEGCSDDQRAEEDELDAETMNGDYDYMQEGS